MEEAANGEDEDGGCEERFAIDCCGAAGAGILARQLATTCLAYSIGTVDRMVGVLVSLGLLLWVIYYVGLVVYQGNRVVNTSIILVPHLRGHMGVVFKPFIRSVYS